MVVRSFRANVTHILPGGTASSLPSLSNNENHSVSVSLDQVPDTTFPSASIHAGPLPVVTVTGTTDPDEQP